MTYTVQISSRGTITIPKEIREDMQIITGSKILIIKRKGEYVIKVVPKLSSLAGSFKTNKVFSDEELDLLKQQAFLTTKKIAV